MSRHNDHISLQQMLGHAQQAVAMAQQRQRQDLETDYMLQLALTRLVEILGEAAARVSPPTREKYPEIPWQAMVGMRNRLIHGYDKVDLNLLWDTIEIDLPPLMAMLERIVAESS